jgi:hypothetical protein
MLPYFKDTLRITLFIVLKDFMSQNSLEFYPFINFKTMEKKVYTMAITLGQKIFIIY